MPSHSWNQIGNDNEAKHVLGKTSQNLLHQPDPFKTRQSNQRGLETLTVPLFWRSNDGFERTWKDLIKSRTNNKQQQKTCVLSTRILESQDMSAKFKLYNKNLTIVMNSMGLKFRAAFSRRRLILSTVRATIASTAALSSFICETLERQNKTKQSKHKPWQRQSQQPHPQTFRCKKKPQNNKFTKRSFS